MSQVHLDVVLMLVNIVDVMMKKTSITTAESFPIKQHINCNTLYVVYVVQCNEYSLKHVGCTICTMKIHIGEHYCGTNNANSYLLSLASKHYKDVHKGNIAGCSFCGIEKIVKPIREDDSHSLLLEWEVW